VQNAQLAALAATDNLTQLPNRRKLDETLESEIARASRYESLLSVVIVDVDHFKQVNDSLGHDGGDAVLAEIARLLRTHVRSSDMAGRWGGEEFLILMPGSDAQAASRLAEKLRIIIADHAFSGIGHVTCSFGAAQYRPGQGVAELFKHADAALYRAKRAGRNRVELAPGDIGASRRRRGA
jgi:diguanylate cyclase (GGDEF)-like protein